MGTAPDAPAPIAGVIERAGGQLVILTERATGIAYGDRTHKHSIWPLLLICVVGGAMALDVMAVGFVGLVLLAIWVGAH